LLEFSGARNTRRVKTLDPIVNGKRVCFCEIPRVSLFFREILSFPLDRPDRLDIECGIDVASMLKEVEGGDDYSFRVAVIFELFRAIIVAARFVYRREQ